MPENQIAVVTAVTGGYDHVRPHRHYRDDVDYLFFTDGTTAPVDPQWEVVPLPTGITNDPWRLAKIPKCDPHAIERLRGYRYVVWIDGDMEIRHPRFIADLLSFLNGGGLLLSPHFDDRHCGYGEAEVVIGSEKYAGEPIAEQCEAYRAEGFPENFGLYECGVQARDMTARGVAEFGHMWMGQILKWSVQDQVSCGYALWRTGLVPDVLPQSWRCYDWLHLNAHAREIPERPADQLMALYRGDHLTDDQLADATPLVVPGSTPLTRDMIDDFDSNVGKWDRHYAGLDPAHPDHYIDTVTYRLGVEWLMGTTGGIVEDWGCGKGWFEHVAGEVSPAVGFRVVGIDGSQTPFAERIEDLATYRTQVPGIFMRAVAEHNYAWRDVLANVLASFTERAFVSFFTPMTDGDDAVQLALAPGYDSVPDLSLPTKVWEAMITEAGAEFRTVTMPSDTAYGVETAYMIWRP